MAAVEVLGVSLPSRADERLLGSAVDVPSAGDSSELLALDIAGWVAGRASPAARVEFVSHVGPVHSTPVVADAERARTLPGVPEDAPCRFRTLVGVVGLPPEFELHLEAVLADGGRVPIGEVRARHAPLRTGFDPRIQPLMVTSTGRSGTTWLMRMLSAHPAAVAHREYPFETCPGKYWVHALKVLSDPADWTRSSGPLRFYGDPFLIGHNPFYTRHASLQPGLGERLGRTHVERLGAFLQERIEDWYATLAGTQGKDSVRYFAEKHIVRPSLVADLTWELYPDAREAFLVRDFRDMASSRLAHGKRDASDVERYVRETLAGLASDLLQAWQSRGDRGHLLRYEDLVFRPRESLVSLLEYLDLDSSDAVLEEVTASTPGLDFHRTSPDAPSSVGRWRREPDQAFRSLCDEVFHDVLEEFGYLDVERV